MSDVVLERLIRDFVELRQQVGELARMDAARGIISAGQENSSAPTITSVQPSYETIATVSLDLPDCRLVVLGVVHWRCTTFTTLNYVAMRVVIAGMGTGVPDNAVVQAGAGQSIMMPAYREIAGGLVTLELQVAKSSSANTIDVRSGRLLWLAF